MPSNKAGFPAVPWRWKWRGRTHEQRVRERSECAPVSPEGFFGYQSVREKWKSLLGDIAPDPVGQDLPRDGGEEDAVSIVTSGEKEVRTFRMGPQDREPIPGFGPEPGPGMVERE